MTEVSFSLKRLETLKQETIIQFLESVNLDTIMGFYDSMIEHVFRGDLDSKFMSKTLVGIDDEEKAEIFQLARKHKGLCFYAGDVSFWADSMEGVYLSDVDLVCMRLFDNYDFLLSLAKDGGENALKQLDVFQKGHMSTEGSVIDCLRNTFGDDDTLHDIVIEMSKEDGKYKGLSDSQKEILCSYPEGVLFDTKDQKKVIVPPEELVRRIQSVYFGTDAEELRNLESIGRILSDEEEFETAISDVFYGQQEEIETGFNY